MNSIMILNSQPLPEFALIRENSWLVHSFCPSLLSRPSCRLCPCLLCFSSLCTFVSSCPRQGPLWLSGYKSIMQNKPNFRKPGIAATPYSAKSSTNIPLHAARKNKPNQTQFQPKTRALLDPERSRRANQTRRRARGGPIYRGEARQRRGEAGFPRNTPGAIRDTLHEIRFTLAPWGRCASRDATDVASSGYPVYNEMYNDM